MITAMTTYELRRIVPDAIRADLARRMTGSVQIDARETIGSACENAERSGRSPGDAAVVETFYALFNEGVISWGLNRSNPCTDHAHVTGHGLRVLADLDRDPTNPSGYLAEVSPWISSSSIAWSYVTEAVHSYNAGAHRGAAVLLGCAAEALVLEVREELVSKLRSAGVKPSKSMLDWKAKSVIDEIGRLLDAKAKMPRELAERFDEHLRALFHHVRLARNEAGHPANVRPIERTEVHANLLLLPTIARLAHDVRAWVATEYVP